MGVCKSIATLSVYNEALVVLLFIVMGSESFDYSPPLGWDGLNSYGF